MLRKSGDMRIQDFTALDMYSISHLRPITKLSTQSYQLRKRVPRASIGDKIKLGIIVAMGFTTIRGCSPNIPSQTSDLSNPIGTRCP